MIEWTKHLLLQKRSEVWIPDSLVTLMVDDNLLSLCLLLHLTCVWSMLLQVSGSRSAILSVCKGFRLLYNMALLLHSRFRHFVKYNVLQGIRRRICGPGNLLGGGDWLFSSYFPRMGVDILGSLCASSARISEHNTLCFVRPQRLVWNQDSSISARLPIGGKGRVFFCPLTLVILPPLLGSAQDLPNRGYLRVTVMWQCYMKFSWGVADPELLRSTLDCTKAPRWLCHACLVLGRSMLFDWTPFRFPKFISVMRMNA